MLTKLRHKGALFIEYALILAFVVVVGSIFVSGNGFTDSIKSIFTNTSNLLAQAAGQQPSESEYEKKFQAQLKDFMAHITDRSCNKVWAGQPSVSSVDTYKGPGVVAGLKGTDEDGNEYDYNFSENDGWFINGDHKNNDGCAYLYVYHAPEGGTSFKALPEDNKTPVTVTKYKLVSTPKENPPDKYDTLDWAFDKDFEPTKVNVAIQAGHAMREL